MGVSKNRGTPKWMVYNIMENWTPLLKWMIWGYPYFWKHPHGKWHNSNFTPPEKGIQKGLWMWDCLFKMISPQVADGKSLVQSIRGGSAEPEDHPVSIRSSDLQAFVLLCVNWWLRLAIYYSGHIPSRSPSAVWDCQNTGKLEIDSDNRDKTVGYSSLPIQ